MSSAPEVFRLLEDFEMLNAQDSNKSQVAPVTTHITPGILFPASMPPTDFPLFSKLPGELRNMIWCEHLFEPRHIIVSGVMKPCEQEGHNDGEYVPRRRRYGGRVGEVLTVRFSRMWVKPLGVDKASSTLAKPYYQQVLATHFVGKSINVAYGSDSFDFQDVKAWDAFNMFYGALTEKWVAHSELEDFYSKVKIVTLGGDFFNSAKLLNVVTKLTSLQHLTILMPSWMAADPILKDSFTTNLNNHLLPAWSNRTISPVVVFKTQEEFEAVLNAEMEVPKMLPTEIVTIEEKETKVLSFAEQEKAIGRVAILGGL